MQVAVRILPGMSSPTAFRSSPRATVGRPRGPWGVLAAVDIDGCERAALADAGRLTALVAALVDAVGLGARGPLTLERLGAGDREGWSATQLVAAGTLTLHADEVAGRLFIDAFSCLPFDPATVGGVAVEAVGGSARTAVLERG